MSHSETTHQGTDPKAAPERTPKAPFEEPKLAFIQPQLVKHGDATKVTKNGFFGTFEP